MYYLYIHHIKCFSTRAIFMPDNHIPDELLEFFSDNFDHNSKHSIRIKQILNALAENSPSYDDYIPDYSNDFFINCKYYFGFESFENIYKLYPVKKFFIEEF